MYCPDNFQIVDKSSNSNVRTIQINRTASEIDCAENSKSYLVSSKRLELLFVSSNLTSTIKTIFKEKWMSSCQESGKYSPWARRNWSSELVIRGSVEYPAVPGGWSFVRLRLGR